MKSGNGSWESIPGDVSTTLRVARTIKEDKPSLKITETRGSGIALLDCLIGCDQAGISGVEAVEFQKRRELLIGQESLEHSTTKLRKGETDHRPIQ